MISRKAIKTEGENQKRRSDGTSSLKTVLGEDLKYLRMDGPKERDHFKEQTKRKIHPISCSAKRREFSCVDAQGTWRLVDGYGVL